MGREKDLWITQQERGYSSVEGNVCAECLTDEDLKARVQDGASEKVCYFCGEEADHEIAVPLNDLMEPIVGAIQFSWNDPDNEGIVYESAEGGYQAELTDTREILSEMDITQHEELFEVIAKAIHNDYWVDKDYYIGSNYEQFTWGWEAFCDEVIHRKRYLFLHAEDDGADWEIKPSNFLFKLADFKNRTLDDVDLIREIDMSTDIYRVRVGSQKYLTAGELGAPPAEFAVQPNRMSPAGIPMFYGSFDVETAILETYDPEHKRKEIISIGTFRPLRTLRLLDLSALPDIPGIFNLDQHHLIHALRFFHGFAADIAKPISRNGREHIEYVPTQIVTEFFRHIYRTSAGDKLDGIIYRSSREGGQDACVIFCENHQASDDKAAAAGEHLLRLIRVEHRDT